MQSSCVSHGLQLAMVLWTQESGMAQKSCVHAFPSSQPSVSFTHDPAVHVPVLPQSAEIVLIATGVRATRRGSQLVERAICRRVDGSALGRDPDRASRIRI